MPELNLQPASDALAHVSILCKDPDPPALERFTDEGEVYARERVRNEFLHTVRALGGAVLTDRGDPVRHAMFFEPGQHRYTLNRSAAYADIVRERLPRLIDGFKQPEQTPYLRACAKGLADRLPYVLALTDERGGDGKYLIETPEQHKKAVLYMRDRAASTPSVVGRVVARDFIRTPSDHYTSYRTLTTATGSIVAAGLLYSAHKKTDDKLVTAYFLGLSNPDTRFFLGARDVRSNVSQGGRVIPLMGDNRRAITSEEREILAAHGIDPDNPALPEHLQEQSATIAWNHGRVNNMYNGTDFIQSESGEFFFLEDNADPGSETYRVCHFGNGRIDYGKLHENVYGQITDDLLNAI